MKKPIFCTIGDAKSLLFAKKQLRSWGYSVTNSLQADVTHLLLPVPTDPKRIPEVLPEGLTIMGGRLPVLKTRTVDFLQDEHYLQENAAITADCALEIAREHMALTDKRVLIIGWGRIGKCLSARLNTQAVIAVRKPKALQQIKKMGLESISMEDITPGDYDLIFNTAPAPVLDATGSTALCIDLASVRGIQGDDVIWARALPGRMAPESAGTLMAKTALRYALL